MTRWSLALVSLLHAGCGYPEFAFANGDTGAVVDSTSPPPDSSEPVDSTLDSSPFVDTAKVDSARPDVAPCDAGCGVAEFCSDGVCRPESSCAAIKTRFPTLATGAYTIDPDGAGPLTPFRVFCEMGDGGGWTLAMKLDGAETTFGYDSPLWTNDLLVNPTSIGLSENEAKFRSFSELPVKQVRLGMVDTTARFITVDVTATSLRALFAGTRVTTTAGRAKWLSLVSTGALQTSCNEEGVNLDYTTATLGAKFRLRIGIVGNNETDCNSPDSFLGFGASVGDLYCFGGVDPALVVGNLAPNPTLCTGTTQRTTRTFGYIFVR